MASVTEENIIGRLSGRTGLPEELVGRVVGAIEDLSAEGEPVTIGHLTSEKKSPPPNQARPDTFFDREQIDRLNELMRRWRDARDQGIDLDAGDQRELDRLIDLEFQASEVRAASK